LHAIEGDDVARYVYCHGSRLTGVEVGDQVTVGQLLMWSGNTGRSGAPHLHLEVKVDGQQRCPQALLRAVHDTGSGVLPATLPADGCRF
jgi:murein DD-endopeptidase MepM/ murein hydrolase activator NlpD